MSIHENTVLVNTHSANKNTQKHFDWREDLAHSRDLNSREIEAFGYVLGWLEDWRVKNELPPGRDAACRWWREVAKAKERPAWQLRQWEEGIRWSRIEALPRKNLRSRGFASRDFHMKMYRL